MGTNKSTITIEEIYPLHREAYTVEQLIPALGLSKAFIQKLFREGLMQGTRLPAFSGSPIIATREQVYDWLDSLLVHPKGGS
jgi:hypothetical protein